MTTFGYCRVSTDRQADTGESLATQERAVAGYAMMHGLPTPIAHIERAVSGSIPFAERPEGSKLIAALQPGDHIITPKMDRAFRSAIDALNTLATLQSAKVTLHMIDLGGDVSSPGIGKLVFTILAAVAEGERDRIKQRIQEVKRDQKQRGCYLGGAIPFGFALTDGRLAPHVAQQAAVAQMRVLRASGSSLRAIAAEVRALGFAISHQGVQEVLRREPPQ